MNTGAKGSAGEAKLEAPFDLSLTQNRKCSGALTDRGASPRGAGTTTPKETR